MQFVYNKQDVVKSISLWYVTTNTDRQEPTKRLDVVVVGVINDIYFIMTGVQLYLYYENRTIPVIVNV